MKWPKTKQVVVFVHVPFDEQFKEVLPRLAAVWGWGFGAGAGG